MVSDTCAIGVSKALVGAIAALSFSLRSLGGELQLFKYTQEGEVTLWGEVLDRQEALLRIAGFRKWASECLLLFGTLCEADKKLMAETISCAEKLLSVIPEHSEALDRSIFDAVVELSTVLQYFPPQPPPYDACFVALGTIGEASSERKNYVAIEAILWPGRSCREPRDFDEALVLTGEDVKRCTISSVHVSRPRAEGKAEDIPKAIVAIELKTQDESLPDFSTGQTVLVLRRTSTYPHQKRAERLRALYAEGALPPRQDLSAERSGRTNSELAGDAVEEVSDLHRHSLGPTLLRELLESRSARSSGGPKRSLLSLGLSLVGGAVMGSAVVLLFMRRKRAS